jgi:hypothetical protein
MAMKTILPATMPATMRSWPTKTTLRRKVWHHDAGPWTTMCRSTERFTLCAGMGAEQEQLYKAYSAVENLLASLERVVAATKQKVAFFQEQTRTGEAGTIYGVKWCQLQWALRGRLFPGACLFLEESNLLFCHCYYPLQARQEVLHSRVRLV